ncbi:FimV/HubP family polar landmark protein [Tahibacter soli]|uniref:FimV N-terminal domain-containing protein n=1 Tax=Tahibacter soli TaxID=2983605 RepID=A0A9X3YJ15_9GAMM|nr:FimV/HubP family polar landmark protein [Tahibacter soli]MDC8011738.1 hypothetical protein [Tahibacter soli]
MKLSLAVALALAGSDALALGLGMIQVRSGLNEPLNAEIPVTGGPDETASLSVALAAAADFERVGLSRSRVQVPLEFTVAAGARGAVIKVTSKEPVRDPFLDFLIEVNWAKGKLLREYTVLLDPPTMAPAIKGSRASTAPVKETATTAAPSQSLPAAKPGKAPRPTKSAEPVASAPPSTPPAEKPSRAGASAGAGEYGPVAAGETLWEVAAATRPDDNVTLNQVMLALHRNNPSAFFKDNINSLKRGAILRVPSVEEIKAVGSAASAAAEVRNQNDASRSGTPTLVADSAASASAPAAAPATKTAQPDRLALVPPKSSKDSKPTAESAGSGTSASGDVTTRAELARTKEALASREQETNELKSRVRELEEIKNKNDKLISFKDSELAELQKKLKELQDKAAKPGAAPAATTPAATPPSTAATTPATATPKPGEPPKTGEFSKEEIWGSAAGDKAPAASTTPSATAGTTPSSTTPPPSTGTTPPASTTTPSPTTGTTPPSTTSTLPPATATPSTTTPPASTTGTPPSTTATTPPATTAPAATPPKPAASTTAPAKAPTPAKVQPLAADEPWWQKTWVLAVGGLALLAVVGLALMNLLRRPKAAPAADTGAGDNTAYAGGYDEEHGLLDRLAQYPDDTSAHLELTSLYYAQGQADKFEDAAQAMYAHISDTSMAEWQQVRAMGRELAPHNPLFADEPSYQAPTHAHTFGSSEPEPMRFDGFDDVSSFGKTQPAAALPEEDTFDFDLADRSATTQTIPAPAPAPAAPARDDFSLDLPPMDFDTRISQPSLTPPPSFSTPAPPPSRIEDDLMATDDAIGTKLDLAKAYLDMGDPDGAKSMLEEVIAEGSDKQKAEARKLLAEIR